MDHLRPCLSKRQVAHDIIPLMSPSLATSETLQCETKFVARATQMFLGDNRDISCLHD